MHNAFASKLRSFERPRTLFLSRSPVISTKGAVDHTTLLRMKTKLPVLCTSTVFIRNKHSTHGAVFLRVMKASRVFFWHHAKDGACGGFEINRETEPPQQAHKRGEERGRPVVVDQLPRL